MTESEKDAIVKHVEDHMVLALDRATVNWYRRHGDPDAADAFEQAHADERGEREARERRYAERSTS